MLVKETTEGLKRKMEVRLKLDEAHVSSSALISEICLYCKDKKIINYLVEINDLLFLENNWLNMNKKEIDEGLEKLKLQIFEIFSNLREEIEISSMFTYSDIKDLFIRNNISNV